MNKFFRQFGKYKWLWLAGIVIVVLVVVLVGVINAGDGENQGREEEIVTKNEQIEANENEVTDINEEATGEVVFRNSKFLEDFLGTDAARVALNTISESILNFIGDNGNYTAFVAGSDLEKGVSFPFSTMEFTAQVSNGENYFVQIALIKDAYFGMLVEPAESNETEFYVDYLRSGAEAGYTEEEALSNLQNWAGEVRPEAIVKEIEVLGE